MNPHQRVRAEIDEQAPDGVIRASTLSRLTEGHGDLRDGDSWGPWSWDARHRTLDYTGGPYAGRPYSIHVDRILEAENPDAETWGWVRHVGGKRWDPPAIRCLVLALTEVLRQVD